MAKSNANKVKINFSQALQMIYPYAKSRIIDQIKSVSIIVIYLILFQIVVLGIPIDKAGVIGIGIALVIFGLAFFMDGLNLGLMPLGEICGVKLPQKSKIAGILIFALILGIGATFAEPAIGVLKAAGASVKPWAAPLLFRLLNKDAGILVWAVGIGVGLAVMFGMLRFLYNWSLKPFIFSLIPLLLLISVLALFNKNLEYLTGLAWDCGGVTTGPVTVPLVLALGIGISRIIGGKDSGGGGFGVVTLASAFPILTVFLLGIFLVGTTPSPMSEADFVCKENRAAATALFSDSDAAAIYVLKNMSPENRLAFFDQNDQNDQNQQNLEDYLKKLASDDNLIAVHFSDRLSFETWLYENNDYQTLLAIYGSEAEISALYERVTTVKAVNFDVPNLLKKNLFGALQAILPLSLFLIIVLSVFLREKISRKDELFLGLFFAVVGMSLFNIGIEMGLSRLGDQIGQKLPSSFKAIALPEQKKVISNFDTSLIYDSIKANGEQEKFFYMEEGSKYIALPFEENAYNKENKQYTYVPMKGPLFGKEGGLLGIFVVLLFAFVMGYSATLAEPALNALGATVENLTVGTFKKSLLMQAVAIGVGIGLFFGVAKIIWNFPLIYLTGGPYILLIFITAISSEDFVNIGWDSAGVTTGPITVPLVLAMGLGIGGQVGVVEGFGILASASVFPILSVLSVGLYVNHRRKKALKEVA